MSADQLTLCSYNLHGFNVGQSFLKILCENNSIIFVQEHWLQSSQLDLFNNIDQRFMFYGKSAMGNRVMSGMLRGRPFGGVGVLVRKDLAPFIKLYDCDADGRVVVIKFENNSVNMLMFGIYLPCDDHSADYLNSLHQIFGYIESFIDMYPGYKYIISGDFNFECNMSSRGFREFSAFIRDFNLVVCDDLDCHSHGFTYNHASLDQKSLIDHVFVHCDLVSSIAKYEIISDGANLSDHSPIRLCLSHYISHESVPSNVSSVRHVLEHRWDKGDLWNYYQYSGNLLNNISHTLPCVDSGCNCNNADHHIDIEVYYAEIVHCLSTAAKAFVPQIPKAALKHYWSVALEELKQDSCNTHNVWLATGKPRNGQIYEMKKNAHYKYKLAVKDAISAFEGKFTDELLDNYLHKDMNKFWETWKKKSSEGPPVIPHIEGATNDIAIANKFADFFNLSVSASSISVDNSDVSISVDDVYECRNWLLTVEDVDSAIRNNLKMGKAAGIDHIVAEHIIYAHPAVVSHLNKLFNLMIIHGYVPNKFGHSIIVPLIKDRCGDLSKMSNYRGISLSPVISKLFEVCLSSKFSDYLLTHNLQFGFKKNSSCASAVYVVQQSVDYFTSRGSNVYLSALDASKAFDRVNFNILFKKLVSRDTPQCLLNIVKNWYYKLSAVVRWNGVLSYKFRVRCGVRQGGVLSPFLFNIYVDDLICCMESSNLGCQINGMFLGCIMYADDILLMSTSVLTLQSMLDICHDYMALNMILYLTLESHAA